MASITEKMARPDVEKSILHVLLVDDGRRETDLAYAQLKPRDFSDERHKRLYQALQDMRARKQPIDLVTLDNAHPEVSESAIDIGSGSDAWIPTANLEAYVKILKAVTARRDFKALGEHLVRASAEDQFDETQLTEKIRLYLKNMGQNGGEDTTITELLGDLYDAIFTKPENEWALKTGISGLDDLLDGLRPGRMYVVGARPGTGKTVLGLHVALRCAIAGKPVLYVNREMEKMDLLKRQLAAMSTAHMNELQGGVLPENKWESVTDAVSAMYKMPIHISNNAKTPAEIRAKAVEIYEQQGLGLIVIDYLQRLSPDSRCRSRDEEVGQMSNAIKDLALDLKTPVLLLSQLNRDEQNKRPSMSRLRESGNIEQDADVVVLLHEPDAEDVPHARQEARRGIYGMGGKYIEMIVDKNRHGKVGITAAAFFGAAMKYKSL